MGRKKLTMEHVRKAFEQRGYELLEDVYINNKTKMKYRCPKHPDKNLMISYSELSNQGNGCPYCANQGKPTIDEVKKHFQNEGYELLEDKYINMHTPMRYKCPKHHDKELNITYTSFKHRGSRCPYCRGVAKATLEDVKSLFELKGYILLENTYHNSKQHLRYICSKHPDKVQMIDYDHLKQGNGCSFCANRGVPTFSEVETEFSNRGYELLESTYINNRTLMKYKCPKHPDKIQTITYSNLKYGRGCRYCGIEMRSGENSTSWKGGLTELNAFLRNQIDEWKREYLKQNNYRCAITNEGGKLHIHHSKPFHKIRDEVFEKINMPIHKTVGGYTEEELELIVSELRKRHDEVVGVPMKKEIHRLFHSAYGYNDTTLEDLYEFKIRYLAGEFKNAI